MAAAADRLGVIDVPSASAGKAAPPRWLMSRLMIDLGRGEHRMRVNVVLPGVVEFGMPDRCSRRVTVGRSEAAWPDSSASDTA